MTRDSGQQIVETYRWIDGQLEAGPVPDGWAVATDPMNAFIVTAIQRLRARNSVNGPLTEAPVRLEWLWAEFAALSQKAFDVMLRDAEARGTILLGKDDSSEWVTIWEKEG